MLHYAADAPTWTDKLEAWATLGGTTFTALAVIVAFLVWRHDQKLRREAKLEAESTQARLVILRITGAVGDPEKGWLGITCTVENNSSNKIFDVGVHARAGDIPGTFPVHRLGDLPGSSSKDAGIVFVPPSTWRFSTGPTRAKVTSMTDYVVDFTDSAGLRWSRHNQGEPYRSAKRALLPDFRLRTMVLEFLYIRAVERWFAGHLTKFERKLRSTLATKLHQRRQRVRRRRAEALEARRSPAVNETDRPADHPRDDNQEAAASE